MAAGLRLRVRTPAGLVVDRPVAAVRAEDASGWFGILPGRANLLAVLPPGLLVYRDAEGEGFVAVAGGLLDLHDDECRVIVREAVATRALEVLADRVDALMRSRSERRERQTGVLSDLTREALRRLAVEVRT